MVSDTRENDGKFIMGSTRVIICTRLSCFVPLMTRPFTTPGTSAFPDNASKPAHLAAMSGRLGEGRIPKNRSASSLASAATGPKIAIDTASATRISFHEGATGDYEHVMK